MMRDRIRRRSDSEPVGSLCMCGMGCVSTVAPSLGLPPRQPIDYRESERAVTRVPTGCQSMPRNALFLRKQFPDRGFGVRSVRQLGVKSLFSQLRTVTLTLTVLTLLCGCGDSWDRASAKVDAQSACETAVLSRLKHPDVAEFDHRTYRPAEGGRAAEVRGQVRTVNGFNAPVRVTYGCHITSGRAIVSEIWGP